MRLRLWLLACALVSALGGLSPEYQCIGCTIVLALAEEGALPSAAVMLGAGGDVADAAARLLKSFAECFDEAIDEAKAKVKK